MDKEDIQLLDRIGQILDVYLEDQKKTAPLNSLADIHHEFKGDVSELLDIEHFENKTLVCFISSLIEKTNTTDKGRTIQLMEDMSEVVKTLSIWANRG